MNKTVKRNIVVGLCLLLVVVIVGILLSIKPAKKTGKMYSTENMACAEGYLFYNDGEDNLIRYSIGNKEIRGISKNRIILGTNRNEILVKYMGTIDVADLDGVSKRECYEIDTHNAQLDDNYIYFRDNETGYISRIIRATGEIEPVINLSVKKFVLNQNKLLFVTADGTMIYIYDIETGMPMGYFGDKKIVDFDVDENIIAFADANNDYLVSKFNVTTGAEEVVRGVKTKSLEYANGRIFYLENVKGNKDEYRIKIEKSGVH